MTLLHSDVVRTTETAVDTPNIRRSDHIDDTLT